MTEQEALKDALKVFGQSYIAELSNQLRREGKVASGKLLRSLDTRLIKTAFGTIYTIELIAENYLEYIDGGRPPTKRGGNGQVFRDIKKWVRLKGIPEKFAYPIAKSIHEKGYKGTNVLDKTLKAVERDSRARNEFQDDLTDWVDELVEDLMFDVSKNNNITVRIK